MKDSAQVVVIGGGIVGCSVAYHLAKYGWTDVVLVERQELTSGSSWHAAGGLFTVVRPNAPARIHKYTFETYREIESESGQSCGFHFTGGMNICRTIEEVDSNRMLQSACRILDIESYFISPEEARRKAPILDTTDVIACLWETDGGHVDPASATQAFARAARKLGVEIYRHTPVIQTEQRSDGSWMVGTEKGNIIAEYVVNAAGLWGREVGRLAGIELPLMPVEHHYLVTESIPEIERLEFELPQINDNETGCYARQEGQGLLLGAYEKVCTHWAIDGTPQDFGHELLPDDLSRMDWNFQKSVDIMPCLAQAGIKRVINGPMIFSPDLGPLIGPHPELQNYFCANGVMAGFNQGPGIGRALAEWMIQGEPEFDLFCWDVARYGHWATKSYTQETTRYFYENRSEKIVPYQEFDAGRPIHKPPIYDQLESAGAVFGASFGLEHVNWFSPTKVGASDSLTFRQPNWWQPVIDEGKRVRNEVGLMEYSAMAKFEVSGPDAESWLNHIMANRMPDTGQVRLTPMLSEQGRLIGDFSVSRIGEDRFLILGADVMQLSFMRHFGRFLPSDGVSLENQSADYAGLHLCGPNAQELLARLAEEEMDTLNFPFLHAATISIGAIPNIIALRVSFTGETGYELYLPLRHQPILFELLMKEGRNLGIGLVGTRCLMQTRLEKSFPAWGLELSPDYTVVEAAMERFVRLDKGEFVGRSAVLRHVPPKLKRVTLVVDARDCAIWGDEAIFLDGELVGAVSSGGYGPESECHIAMGYIDVDAATASGQFKVEVLGELLPAELCSEPIVDPTGARMRT
ncbi:MAG: FAD-dependent oxidoreductase [Acidiferrobacterales bacterium]|nr:FAD-dependent oxidoreductase [Acidiferrobacterales bacterium]